ncbi:trypsin-3 [Genypterus blacodes]|uniref:trypsin-3 n=1 Tax=Genypterus blacodes TaxID=154954 RepID=UPI003F75B5D3
MTYRWLSLLSTDSFAKRIIGGEEVNPRSVPYQASVQNLRLQHYCGGTLIHKQWVLSAAHCWRPASAMKVVLSEHNIIKDEGFEQVFNVSRIFLNRYNYKTFNNDIMLMRLDRPANLNAYVAPALLPDINTPQNRKCTVSGWGVTHVYHSFLSPTLRAVDVDILSYCEYFYYGRITKNMLCAGSYWGGKDSCQGDSGGPLICNGYLEGIVSWGISCAQPRFPGVYTKVRNYYKWINTIINQFTD